MTWELEFSIYPNSVQKVGQSKDNIENARILNMYTPILPKNDIRTHNRTMTKISKKEMAWSIRNSKMNVARKPWSNVYVIVDINRKKRNLGV